MSAPYPYARLQEDGFELAVVEQGDASTILTAPLPPEKERLGAKPGDLVKLVFQYREPDERTNGAVVGAEHMWVKITDHGDGCLVGRLDSNPQHTKILKSDAMVSFHPKHIIAFWR